MKRCKKRCRTNTKFWIEVKREKQKKHCIKFINLKLTLLNVRLPPAQEPLGSAVLTPTCYRKSNDNHKILQDDPNNAKRCKKICKKNTKFWIEVKKRKTRKTLHKNYKTKTHFANPKSKSKFPILDLEFWGSFPFPGRIKIKPIFSTQPQCMVTEERHLKSQKIKPKDHWFIINYTLH